VTEAADRALMQRAIDLGRQARFWAAPNPAVGCVLARDGEVIGSGYTQPVGQAHAEVMALQSAVNAQRSTAYVTLEPCSHQGHTGPCAQALIDAGVTRVVVAIEDPNPSVSGQGIALLRSAGIAVEVGVLADQAEQHLAGFLLRMRRGWGQITLKVAASLDGRVAMATGESQWITCETSRQDVQRLRAESDLIVTGIGTVLADDCQLTLRPDQSSLSSEESERALRSPPHRMVLDSQGRTPINARILNGSPTTVVTAPGIKMDSSIEQHQLPVDQRGRIVLGDWAHYLGAQSFNTILIEAGPQLSGALIEGGWVDRLVVYQAPCLLGDTGRPMAGFAIDTLSESPKFQLEEVTRSGTDLRIMATPMTTPALLSA
jgi:diaminohydroxyphosphoribosylaminopyrimidine deaminase/5-amino-6-(5-phosphoribosylamino)uracil reductase